jgi:DHA2 family multidrug resistance protein
MSGAVASPAQPHPPAAAPIPWVGIAAVLFGAVATTLTTRLTSAGLADVRGAIGAGFDEGAWITTVFGAAQMLVGLPTVWLGRSFGPRRMLLAGCALYGISELLIPVAPNLPSVLMLQALAGIGSGTFIPLTVVFVLVNLPARLKVYGIAVYAMNITLGLNIAASLEGWYSEYASWHWIFWQNAVVAVPLFALFWFGMPRVPLERTLLSNIRFDSMFFGSVGLMLVYVAMDQGDRLDWGASDFIVFIAALGVTMVGVALVLETFGDRPQIAFQYLSRPNIALLIVLIVVIRILVGGSNSIVPNFLAQVRGLRPLEAGHALLWIGLPQLLFAPATAWLLGRMDARILVGAGMLIAAIACWLASQLNPAWAEQNFAFPLVLQALGQSMALIASIAFLSRHATPALALTFGALTQFARLFGGEIATSSLTVLTRKAEQWHSNILGQHAGISDPATLDRLQAYAASVLQNSQGTGLADDRAVGLLSAAVRAQAYTLAFADAFRFTAAVGFAGFLIALLLRSAPPEPPQFPPQD